MQNKTLTIFIDGVFKKVSEDKLKKFSPGFLKGFGVFETLLCEEGKIFFLPEHYRRFLYGCDRYILPKLISRKEIRQVLGKLLKENGLKNGRVRLAAWRQGNENHFAVILIPRQSFPTQVYLRGFSAIVYPRKLDRSVELAKIKSLAYHFFLQAYEYALKNNAQEAVLINSSGEIVEGSRSNIFLVKSRKLFTPSLSSGCLAGITRQAVLKAAKASGIKTAAVSLSVEDLKNCDEAFLTNSLVGIMPLTSFQGHKIGRGRPGPLTARLWKSYKNLSQKHYIFLV